MPKIIREKSVLLTQEEYDELSNPDKCYTFMTKTLANKTVKHLLKVSKFECWHDDTQEVYCDRCPVMTLLGRDTGERICIRSKNWSK